VLALFAAPRAVAQDDALPVIAAGPAPLITAGPKSPDNDLAPRWSFEATGVATSFECSLSRDDALVGDWAPCASPGAYDLSGQPDGVYRFAVRALEADGALSETGTADYTLDTSVPGLPTIVALPGPAAADRSPEWRFTGGSNERFECRLDRDDDAAEGWGPCSSPHEVDLTGEADGAFVFSVRGVAPNGTRGPARTAGYLLDTHAPDAPVFASSPPTVGNDASPTLSFATEAGAQAECRAVGADGADSGWVRCASPYDFDLGGRPDGSYALAVRAADAAGNTGSETATGYTLDTTPPAAPAVDAPAVTPAGRLQPSFDFADEAGVAYECRLDGPGGYATGWQPCVSPAPYDLTGQPDGLYTFAVRGTDTAGNTGEPGSATYELARDPNAVALSAGPGRTGRTRQPQWSFQVTGGSGFVCSLDFGTTVVFKPATCGSPRSYNLSGKPDGVYRFTVRTAGTAGGHEPATQDYALDSTPPAQPAVTAAPVSPAPDDKPAWRFAGEDGAALDCRVTRGQATVVDWTPCTNGRRFDLGAVDGDYRVTVRARDAAGNVGPGATSSYQRDATPPAVPTLSAAPKPDDIDRSPTWSFSAESGARFSCTLTRGSDVVGAKTSCAGAKTYNLSGAQPGTYTFSVEATDAAGNTSAPRVAKYVLAAAPAKATGGTGGGAGSGGSGSVPGTGPSASAGGGSGPADAGAGAGPSAAGGGAQQPRSSGATRVPSTSYSASTPGRRPATGGSPARASHGPASTGSRAAGTTRRGDRDGAGSAAGDRRVGAPDAPNAAGRRDAGSERGLRDKLEGAIGSPGRDVARALTGDVAKKVFPVSVLVLLGLFLLVQSRIDRGEPKLALAPIDADPDLEFGPPPTLR